MQITDIELKACREMLRAGDVDLFMRWVAVRGVIVDRAYLEKTMRLAAKTDPDKAVKLFDVVFVGMDPERDRLVARIRLVALIVVPPVTLAGCVGGILYLLRAIFG